MKIKRRSLGGRPRLHNRIQVNLNLLQPVKQALMDTARREGVTCRLIVERALMRELKLSQKYLHPRFIAEALQKVDEAQRILAAASVAKPSTGGDFAHG